MELMIFVYTFLAVFILNIIPFLGPPTWMLLSYILFFYRVPSIPLFILTALIAATIGRFVLASFSKNIIRNRFLSMRYRKNLNHLRTHLQKNILLTSGIFLLEAFTPVSSDELFIAYGLTGMKLRYALIPFFIGRTFTYSFWVYTTLGVIQNKNMLLNFSFLSFPFVITLAILLLLLYFFVKVDWEYLFVNHKLRIIR